MGEIRDLQGRFVPGTPSPNPGGRPRGLAQQARAIADAETMLRTLLSIALDEEARDADRIRAAEVLLDRGHGRAPAHAAVEGADPLGRSELDEAIRSVANELLARRRETQEPEQN